jgi:MerR family copper efflux transcriptional regulator
MQIGQAAGATGVSAKMIRHYEAIGLVPPAGRRDSNYRDYGSDDLHRLGFIRRARDLGFSIEEIRELLRLWGDKDRTAADVKALAEGHIAELDRKIAALGEMRATLGALVDACGGGNRPHCPIIEGLEGSNPAGSGHGHHRHD